jgi:hypothetical protein
MASAIAQAIGPGKIGIAYVHVAVTPKIPRATLEAIRHAFTGTIIRCNAMAPETADAKGYTDYPTLA